MGIPFTTAFSHRHFEKKKIPIMKMMMAISLTLINLASGNHYLVETADADNGGDPDVLSVRRSQFSVPSNDCGPGLVWNDVLEKCVSRGARRSQFSIPSNDCGPGLVWNDVLEKCVSRGA